MVDAMLMWMSTTWLLIEMSYSNFDIDDHISCDSCNCSSCDAIDSCTLKCAIFKKCKVSFWK
jgi:hypothetical protein